jgi:hypothetical protein
MRGGQLTVLIRYLRYTSTPTEARYSACQGTAGPPPGRTGVSQPQPAGGRRSRGRSPGPGAPPGRRFRAWRRGAALRPTHHRSEGWWPDGRFSTVQRTEPASRVAPPGPPARSGRNTAGQRTDPAVGTAGRSVGRAVMRATQGRQEAVRARTGARVRQTGHAASRQGADVLMSRTYLDAITDRGRGLRPLTVGALHHVSRSEG